MMCGKIDLKEIEHCEWRVTPLFFYYEQVPN